MNSSLSIKTLALGLLLVMGLYGFSCGPTLQDCVDHSDCAAGQECVSYQCISPTIPTGCRQDSDCRPGGVCGKGGCFYKEICGDNKDNDYDGKIDEGCSPVPCTSISDCGKGQVCSKGKCINGPPCGSEVCGDNKDNDCDGKIDEDCKPVCSPGQSRACYTGPVGTENVGICKGGVQNCMTNGQWSFCVGQQNPRSELCDNNLDENCNGQVDEKPCATPPCRKDADCPSDHICAKGTCLKKCSREICGDKQDNDCDGTVDEKDCETPRCQVNADCPTGWTCGKGTCVRNCQSKEICGDKLDNDCNGKIDDGCSPVCKDGETRTCYSGFWREINVGVCRAGKQTCTSGKWDVCKGAVKPALEVCGDKLDNNCNGLTDEHCTSRSCASNADCQKDEFCNQGICSTQQRKCGLDNDCGAGFICHNNICAPAVCAGSSSLKCHSTCKEGLRTCSKGLWGACKNIVPAREYCDGKDNNCDGKIDNDCVDVCRSNNDCRAGFHCKSNLCQAHCVPEICDGKDNDCDGKVDNGCKGSLCLSDKDCISSLRCVKGSCD